jgi:hypothetical protein
MAWPPSMALYGSLLPPTYGSDSFNQTPPVSAFKGAAGADSVFALTFGPVSGLLLSLPLTNGSDVTFSLTYNGQSTGALTLSYAATIAQIAAIISATLSLSSIGAGNVLSVTGNAIPVSGRYIIQFLFVPAFAWLPSTLAPACSVYLLTGAWFGTAYPVFYVPPGANTGGGSYDATTLYLGTNNESGTGTSGTCAFTNVAADLIGNLGVAAAAAFPGLGCVASVGSWTQWINPWVTPDPNSGAAAAFGTIFLTFAKPLPSIFIEQDIHASAGYLSGGFVQPVPSVVLTPLNWSNSVGSGDWASAKILGIGPDVGTKMDWYATSRDGSQTHAFSCTAVAPATVGRYSNGPGFVGFDYTLGGAAQFAGNQTLGYVNIVGTPSPPLSAAGGTFVLYMPIGPTYPVPGVIGSTIYAVSTPLPANATAAQVQAALIAMLTGIASGAYSPVNNPPYIAPALYPTIAGGVTVTGGPQTETTGGSTYAVNNLIYQVALSGPILNLLLSLGGMDVPQLFADGGQPAYGGLYDALSAVVGAYGLTPYVSVSAGLSEGNGEGPGNTGALTLAAPSNSQTYQIWPWTYHGNNFALVVESTTGSFVTGVATAYPPMTLFGYESITAFPLTDGSTAAQVLAAMLPAVALGVLTAVTAVQTGQTVTVTITAAGANPSLFTVSSYGEYAPPPVYVQSPWRCVCTFPNGQVWDSYSPTNSVFGNQGPPGSVGLLNESDWLLSNGNQIVGACGFWYDPLDEERGYIVLSCAAQLAGPTAPPNTGGAAIDAHKRPTFAASPRAPLGSPYVNPAGPAVLGYTQDAGRFWQTSTATGGGWSAMPSLAIDRKANCATYAVNTNVSTLYGAGTFQVWRLAQADGGDYSPGFTFTPPAPSPGHSSAIIGSIAGQLGNERHLLVMVVVFTTTFETIGEDLLENTSGGIEVYDSLDGGLTVTSLTGITLETTGISPVAGQAAGAWIGSAAFVFYATATRIVCAISTDAAQTFATKTTVAVGAGHTSLSAVALRGTLFVLGYDGANKLHLWQSLDLGLSWADVIGATLPQISPFQSSAVLGLWVDSGRLVIAAI